MKENWITYSIGRRPHCKPVESCKHGEMNALLKLEHSVVNCVGNVFWNESIMNDNLMCVSYVWIQEGAKWFTMLKVPSLNCTTMVQLVLFFSKLIQIHFESFLTTLDYFRPRWTFLNRFGPLESIWTILDHLGPLKIFWTISLFECLVSTESNSKLCKGNINRCKNVQWVL